MLKRKRDAIKFMKNFVEGKLSTNCFWEEYRKNPLLQKILIRDKTRIRGIYKFDPQTWRIVFNKKKLLDSTFPFNPDNLLQTIDINDIEHRAIVFGMVKAYFLRRKKKLKYYNRDEEIYLCLMETFPEWVSPDMSFLKDVMKLAPKEYSDFQKLEWCKREIRRLFKFDERPPRWIQEPQWPIVDGKPFIFSFQETDKNDVEHELYYFYDPHTKEKIVVDQYA